MPSGRYQRHRRVLAQRFWEKVDKNGPVPAHRPELGPCWVWKAGKNAKGYGRFGFATGDIRLAHRVAFELEFGRAPAESALHACDNRSCCNPAHLFEGNQAANIRDCIAKGRFARGTSQSTAKLDDDKIRSILTDARSGVSQNALARTHGVSRRLIQEVIRRRRWAHVEVTDA